MKGEAGLFFGLWLQRPLQIAAVSPSGDRLAGAMARIVDLSQPGPVLELGAGTGSLTRGLLRAGCQPERIIAVEREPSLAAVLCRQFPRVATVALDAAKLDQYLRRQGIDRLCGVVSSLPIKWFPVARQRAILEPCLGRLGPRGLFLQMTNAFSSPVAVEALGIVGHQVGRVWLNLPPAQIWAYRARAGAMVAS